MTAPAPAIPRSLFVFSVLYGGMITTAGVLGNKQVMIGTDMVSISIEAGIFAFLMLVVMSSAMAELHGQATANTLVRYGFIPLIVSILLYLAVLEMPAAADMDKERLSGFQLVLGQSPRLMAAGILSYGVSMTLNVTIFSALRRGQGSLLWLRSLIASIGSQIVDTLIFVTVAFYGVFPIGQLLLGQLIAKTVLSVIMVPPLIYLCVAIGRKLDAGGSE